MGSGAGAAALDRFRELQQRIKLANAAVDAAERSGDLAAVREAERTLGSLNKELGGAASSILACERADIEQLVALAVVIAEYADPKGGDIVHEASVRLVELLRMFLQAKPSAGSQGGPYAGPNL